jgi:hypothetical protein
MEAFGKTAALILLPVSLCLAQPLAVGGSISYSSLLGDFGGDVNGGVSLSLVGGLDLSPTEKISILAGFGKFEGTENRPYRVHARSLSARFLLFPMEERPYFLRYSVALVDIERQIGNNRERGQYPAVGFGGGVSVGISDRTHLLFAIGFSRLLEESRSGDILSFDATFTHHP